ATCTAWRRQATACAVRRRAQPAAASCFLRGWLWPLALVGLAALTVGMFVLPSPFPLLALLGLLALGLAAAAYDARWTPARGWHDARAFMARRGAGQVDAVRNRRRAQLATVVSLGLMGLAGIGFRPLSMDEP